MKKCCHQYNLLFTQVPGSSFVTTDPSPVSTAPDVYETYGELSVVPSQYTDVVGNREFRTVNVTCVGDINTLGITEETSMVFTQPYINIKAV